MKSNSSVELASVLRTVLDPALAPVSAGRLLGEIAAALDMARAGAAIPRPQPSWLSALDEACAKLQVMIRPTLQAQTIAKLIRLDDLPKPLCAAGSEVQGIAIKEAKVLERQLQNWRESDEGLQCRVALRRALKQGDKAKPLVLADTQIDDCLRRGEERLESCQQKVRQQTRWRHTKKQGRAVLRQRQVQQFVCLLGHELDSGELDQIIARYRGLAQSRRATRWLKQLIETAALDVAASAAAGAIWSNVQTERRRIEREIFVASVPGAKIETESQSARPRPEFPLRLSFGVTEAVESTTH